MSRLTITLDDDLHRALKETAARQRAQLESDEAMVLAIEEARDLRRR